MGMLLMIILLLMVIHTGVPTIQEAIKWTMESRRHDGRGGPFHRRVLRTPVHEMTGRSTMPR
jgi:hypothetical protein